MFGNFAFWLTNEWTYTKCTFTAQAHFLLFSSLPFSVTLSFSLATSDWINILQILEWYVTVTVFIPHSLQQIILALFQRKSHSISPSVSLHLSFQLPVFAFLVGSFTFVNKRSKRWKYSWLPRKCVQMQTEEYSNCNRNHKTFLCFLFVHTSFCVKSNAFWHSLCMF